MGPGRTSSPRIGGEGEVIRKARGGRGKKGLRRGGKKSRRNGGEVRGLLGKPSQRHLRNEPGEKPLACVTKPARKKKRENKRGNSHVKGSHSPSRRQTIKKHKREMDWTKSQERTHPGGMDLEDREASGFNFAYLLK